MTSADFSLRSTRIVEARPPPIVANLQATLLELGTSTNPGFRMLRVPSTDGEGFLRRGDDRFRGWDG